jgi:hypothetical protein
LKKAAGSIPLREAVMDNSVIVPELLEDIVASSVDPTRKILFVIGKFRALRTAIDAVFDTEQQMRGRRFRKLWDVLH